MTISPYNGPTPDLSKLSDRAALSLQIKADIDEYCKLAYDGGPRSHLGASEIGHKCERYLWYKFRWYFKEELDGQKLRLFNRGHLEEDRYLGWLAGCDLDILDADEEQARMVAVAGHFGGSRDGSILLTRFRIGIPILLEFKTIGEKYFGGLTEGVQIAQPKHWAQICTYGAGFNIKYCLYLNINKNDDSLHVEVVELDLDLGRAMMEKARGIIVATKPPPRISENPSWHECKWCAAAQVCHFNATPLHNCRSCINGQPVEDGQWQCVRWNSLIPTEAIGNEQPCWTRA